MTRAAPNLRPRSSSVPIYALLVIALFACFANAIVNDFTSWDDLFNIANNQRLYPTTLKNFAWLWTHAQHGLYIPVTYTVWFAISSVSHLPEPDPMGIHLNPYTFHAANVIAHAIATLAAFKILELLVPNRWAAALGALVFALHPVQVESIAWLSGLKDVLCGMFALLAIWQYLLIVRPDKPAPLRHRALREAGAIACFVLAMLSKPTAMVVPAIAFATDLWLLKRPLKRVIASLAPWIFLSIVCAAAAAIVQNTQGLQQHVPRAPLWARPFVAGDALAFYLYKLALPIQLAPDYGRRPIDLMPHAWFYATWIIPAGLVAWLWWNRARWPHAWVGALVFVIGVAPLLGFRTFLFQYYSTTADHYLYLSMLGPAVVVARWLSRAGRTGFVVASLIVVALGARTVAQNRVWHNVETLFWHTLDINPRSFAAHNNLGHYYTVIGEPRKALPLLIEAVKLRPDNAQARENLAIAVRQLEVRSTTSTAPATAPK